jgi:hypothetical protein
MFLACRSEDFCLHSGTHYPERVGDNITEEATEAGRGCIQRVGVLSPPVLLTEIYLALLIKGEVYRVEEGDAED